MTKSLLASAPAKINLTLDVLSKRNDGYHELETVMQQIDLVDWIFLETTAAGIEISSNNPLLPNNEANLVYQAAQAMLCKYLPTQGVKIIIDKIIPLEAGLAGGSSNAAAVIKGINQLFDLGLSLQELMQVGATIGSDVPFCIQGGSALVQGRGEEVTPLPPGPDLIIVLVKPPFSISTAQIYQRLNLDKIKRRPDTSRFLEAWNQNDIISLTNYMENVLEIVSNQAYPEIQQIKNLLQAWGALGAWMSGSGSSVFGIFPDIIRARQALVRIKLNYPEVFLVSSLKV